MQIFLLDLFINAQGDGCGGDSGVGQVSINQNVANTLHHKNVNITVI